MSKKFKNENTILIQGWMINELKLSTNELICFALIYGFSQDGESEFFGSLNYICSALNCSKPTVIKAISSLVSKEYVVKTENKINGVVFYKYKVNLSIVFSGKETLQPVKKELNTSKETLQGGKETLHNNNNNNNNINNKEEYIYKENFEKSLISLGANQNYVRDWCIVRRKAKAADTETAFNMFIKELNLSKKTIDEVLQICCERNWRGFKAEWIEKEKPQEAPKSNFIKGII